MSISLAIGRPSRLVHALPRGLTEGSQPLAARILQGGRVELRILLRRKRRHALQGALNSRLDTAGGSLKSRTTCCWRLANRSSRGLQPVLGAVKGVYDLVRDLLSAVDRWGTCTLDLLLRPLRGMKQSVHEADVGTLDVR